MGAYFVKLDEGTTNATGLLGGGWFNGPSMSGPSRMMEVDFETANYSPSKWRILVEETRWQLKTRPDFSSYVVPVSREELGGFWHRRTLGGLRHELRPANLGGAAAPNVVVVLRFPIVKLFCVETKGFDPVRRRRD